MDKKFFWTWGDYSYKNYNINNLKEWAFKDKDLVKDKIEFLYEYIYYLYGYDDSEDVNPSSEYMEIIKMENEIALLTLFLMKNKNQNEYKIRRYINCLQYQINFYILALQNLDNILTIFITQLFTLNNVDTNNDLAE